MCTFDLFVELSALALSLLPKMEKKTLKEHRSLKHLSQQELAHLSGISLRTIQRLEKNVSPGSPYVIRTLCEALNIEAGNLLLETANENKAVQKEELSETHTSVQPVDIGSREDSVNKTLKYINFSALSVILFPFCNLVAVPVFYLIFKKKLAIPAEKEAALKIISFQIIWSVLTLIFLVFIPLIDHWFLGVNEILEIPLFLWGYLLLLFSHLLITLTTAARLNQKGDPMPYIPNFF